MIVDLLSLAVKSIFVENIQHHRNGGQVMRRCCYLHGMPKCADEDFLTIALPLMVNAYGQTREHHNRYRISW